MAKRVTAEKFVVQIARQALERHNYGCFRDLGTVMADFFTNAGWVNLFKGMKPRTVRRVMRLALGALKEGDVLKGGLKKLVLKEVIEHHLEELLASYLEEHRSRDLLEVVEDAAHVVAKEHFGPAAIAHNCGASLRGISALIDDRTKVGGRGSVR